MVKTALANSAWWLASGPACAAFASALEDPARAQRQILARYLRENAGTSFGREHGFAEIRTPEQFARRVPPRDYDELRPWIERIRRGETNVLTREPVRRLVPTSGSTAARKLIPYTSSMQREMNHAIGPWIFDLYRGRPRALLGPAYWSVTPMAENGEPEESAVPIGFDDDAAYLGGWRKYAVDAAMAAPPAIKQIRSIDLLRYVTLLFLLRRPDLSLISVWHPSFLELLLRDMQREAAPLLADVASGGCSVSADLPAELRRLVESRPDPRRAREIERAGDNVAKVWPRLAVVSCWADGNSAGPAAALAARLRGVPIQPKGLLATEGVVSIPYRGRHPLAIRSHFLEFMDERGNISLAHDLRAGQQYEVMMTTAGGLYRYRLRDLVEVDGMVGRTPSVRFVGKAGLISDRMGEKLTDGFVAGVFRQLFAANPSCSLSPVLRGEGWGEGSADELRQSRTSPFHPSPQPSPLSTGEREQEGPPSFAMLAPDVDVEGCRYTIYLNAHPRADLADALDALLSANPQYAYCRRLGQLLRPRVFRLTGDPYSAYCERLMRTGQRMGDIKPAALSPLGGWSDHFSGAYV